MNHTSPNLDLPPTLNRYLGELERECKQRMGLVPEDILEEARDCLLPLYDYSALDGLSDSEVESELVRNFGIPAQVADEYEDPEAVARSKPGGRSGLAAVLYHLRAQHTGEPCGNGAPKRILLSQVHWWLLYSLPSSACYTCHPGLGRRQLDTAAGGHTHGR